MPRRTEFSHRQHTDLGTTWVLRNQLLGPLARFTDDPIIVFSDRA